MRASIAVLAFVLVAVAAPANAAVHYHIVRQLQLGGEANFDDLRVDSTGRVFVARGTFVAVIDRDGTQVLGQIADTPGAHSIAFDDAAQRGYVSAGRASTVVAFDSKSLARITDIATTGENPDAIVFDATTHRVIAFNGRGRNATVIDAATHAVVGTIALDAKPEFAVTNGSGRVFVNLEDANAIAQIDAKSMAVLQRWPIAGCEEPTGLALDRAHERLFTTCGNNVMVVLDAKTGRVVASLQIGAFVDGAAFDSAKQLAFASAGDGTLTIVHEDTPDRFRVVQTLATQRGARTMTLDERSHRVYVASATYVEAPPAADGSPATPRFSAVPGSFRLLVIEP
jgi:DNA-binding beta-propeller fold protein YncE